MEFFGAADRRNPPRVEGGKREAREAEKPGEADADELRGDSGRGPTEIFL